VRDERSRSHVAPFPPFLPPLRGFSLAANRCPSDESLGYCRSSRTGLAPQGEPLEGAAPAGAHLPVGRQVNACAQAVIRTWQADKHQRGCLMEQRREIRSPKSEGEARRRRGTVRPAGHAPDAGGARFPNPAGRKTIAQHFNAGFLGREGNKSRQGRKKVCVIRGASNTAAETILAGSSAAPPGLVVVCAYRCPPLKRWAILGASLAGLEIERSGNPCTLS